MMLVPRRNNFDLFDDFFDESFFPKKERNLMRTNVKEKKDKYIIEVELPGFEKENINLSLKNGYLNIHAKTENSKKDEDEEKIIRQERFYGECSRSFYVGDEIEEKDIDAGFKNGVLEIKIPKKDDEKKLPESKHIMIK